ncbi:CaiB/BaiF CoA transferase family protein [Bacillus massiliigorillae]|uniref:CaiB/BaiF CoA transferase family protein n=1 Tax=Bacillus massiliigorillae TaxID=1243664 RepID=UPI00039DDFB9|nr:CoA transferase [Bacillus massiliigorillae]
MTLPLEGIRIVDLTMWWSGPMCTSYLGSLGAEVIKIESIQRPDGFRYSMSSPGENWWELGPQFNVANANKKGITLNLNDPEGMKLLKELVAKSDAVIENSSPRVMENFGLSYEKLCEINPSIIMVSMPAYGRTGPNRDQPGFAFTFEILSGIVQVNGYRDDNPMTIGGAGDVISGVHTAFSLLTALQHRERTGEGQLVEVAQVEGCANYMGQQIADASMNGRNWGRLGNRQPNMAPHGVYRCKGEDAWVAIAVANDQEWKQFCEASGNPSWTKDERFNTIQSRYENHDELDIFIENWTSQLKNNEVATRLQEVGVSAGPVVHVNDTEAAPYFQDFFQPVTHPLNGTHLYPTWPVKFSGQRLEHRSPAPLLGQHNEDVLKNILNLSDEEVVKLVNADVIGNVPLGVKQ